MLNWPLLLGRGATMLQVLFHPSLPIPWGGREDRHRLCFIAIEIS
ncbi:hypothetical protein RBSH_05369 [Rhodopirellula baltica SH28]|uniref:Uncharacterized protein n=1 Tax=Rhodopirellula baltica SH28 TaxID=993517 RepID=K5E0R1_RHOBT|nr:hypothetical protein RBSH_05369 [Rhodopirellula baltica SH28]